VFYHAWTIAGMRVRRNRNIPYMLVGFCARNRLLLRTLLQPGAALPPPRGTTVAPLILQPAPADHCCSGERIGDSASGQLLT
jgi:hypothetical protein